VIERHGWKLLFHDCLIEQLCRLDAAAARAKKQDPEGAASQNANVKLFNALSKLILERVPTDPASDEFRQGKTLGPAYRHWRRGKIGRRFRLFFRFDSTSRIIIYAWVNDTESLRSAGSKFDPYVIFQKMLNSGHPPDDWEALLQASKTHWEL
jgi:toxin YhaV